MASIIKSDTKAKAIQKAAQKKVAARKPVPKKKPVVTKPQASKQRGTSDGGTGGVKSAPKPVVKKPVATAPKDIYADRPVLTEAEKIAGAKISTTPATPYETQAPMTPAEKLKQDTMNTKMEAIDAQVITPQQTPAIGSAPGDDRYAQRPPLLPTQEPTHTGSLEEAEERYKDRPDLTPEQKYNFKIQEDQEVKATTEDTVQKVDEAVGGAKTDKTTKPTTTKTPSGKTATTTPSGTGTTSLPEEPKPPVKGEPPSTDNVYADQLKDMKFDYDPFADPEYRETAANLENQVAQMMIGRGGLYSSVASSALSAKLISLQNDMETRAYDRFRQDRDFTLQMAKFTEDQINTAWNQAFQNKQFAFQEEQFAFTKLKEEFDQKMALANYNLSAQAQAFSQKMQTKSYNLSVARYNAERQEAAAQQQLGQQKLLVEGNAQIAANERKKYNTLYQRWLDTGKSDSEIARYFGVPIGVTMGAFGMKVVNKDKYLQQAESQVVADAYQLGMNETYLNSLNSMLSTQNLVSTPKPEPEKPKVTRTYEYDEEGNRTGYKESVAGSNVPSSGGQQYKPMDYGY